MHGQPKRILCAMLALLLALFVLTALPAAAKEEQTRFVFDVLTGANDTSYETGDSPVVLPLSVSSCVFTAQNVKMLGGSSNAIYLSLINQSNANRIHITYTYTENAMQKMQTVTHALDKYSALHQSFCISAPYIANEVSALEISFSSDERLSGGVTLYALFNLSTFMSEEEGEAAFTRCHYNEQTEKIEIAGTVSYEATVFYAGQTLALFALASGEELHLSSKTPIARTGVSFEFSFTVDADTSDALFYRYVVAAVNDKGERIPLCTPVFPTIEQGDAPKESGFKGFHTQTLSTVLDSAPGVELVDVYLDRLHGTQSGGILYAGEHSYYYFDESYVNEIDRRVRNLTGLGTHVYLRFLVGANANGLSYTDYSENDIGVINKLPTIRNEKAQQDVYALTNFLTARYADTTIGRISGIVLGRAADRAATCSYTEADNLSDYTKLYATTLHLIAGTVLRNIPDARIVVPVSDRIWPGYLTEEQIGKDYYTAFFLPSLLSALKSQVMEPLSFSLMLESGSLPDRVTGENGATYGTDRLPDFLHATERLAQEYNFLNTAIFYSWTPDESADADRLKAAYLVLYLTLLREPNVESFFTDFSLAEKKGASHALFALAYLARYIDTNRFDAVSETAMTTLGIGAIGDLFADLNENAVKRRLVQSVGLTQRGYQSGIMALGSYTLWNFSAATSTLGWYAGSECTALSALTDTAGERSLTATMSTAGEYADIAYHFAGPTDLSFAPLMAMQVGIKGVEDTRYEIQLRTYGESDTVIASAIVTAGAKQTLLLDLSDSRDALRAVRGVRLVARSLDSEGESFELRFYSFTLESERLNNTELAERVSAIGQGAADKPTVEQPKRDYTRPLIISMIVLLASAALTAFVILGYKVRRPRQTKK